MGRNLCTALFVAVCMLQIGCGGQGAYLKRYMAEEGFLMHGPNIWADAETIKRSPENVPVYRERDKVESAVATQPLPAPHKPGEPGEGATFPMTADNVANNLLKDIKTAKPIVDGELTYEAMVKLEEPVGGIFQHAKELVYVFEHQAFATRLLIERAEAGEAKGTAGGGEGEEVDPVAELAAIKEWAQVAERVEGASHRLFVSTLKKTPVAARKAWVAVLDSCKQLPQISASIEMMAIKSKRK